MFWIKQAGSEEMGVYERVVAATTVHILFLCNSEGVSESERQ